MTGIQKLLLNDYKIYIIAKSRIQSFCQLVFFVSTGFVFLFLTLIGHKSVIWAAFEWTLHYAGYTPQDNRADFGPISPLPTILGNVPIILVVLKMILSDFPVVWGVLRVIESAWKNVGGAPIANRKYSTCCIFTIRNPDVWGGTPRTPHTIGTKRLNLGFFSPHVCGLSHFEDLIRFIYKSVPSYQNYPQIMLFSLNNCGA